MTYGAYRRALDLIAQGLLRTIMRMIMSGWDPDEDREPQIRVLAPAVAAEVRAARQRMNQLAGEFLQAQAEAQLGRGTIAAPPPPPTDYTDRAAATTLRQNLSGPRQTAARKIGAATVRHAEQAARDAVEQSAVEWESEPEPADPDEDERPAPPEREQVKAAAEPEDAPRRSRLRISFGDDEDSPAVLEDPDPPEGVRPVAWARVLSGAENCAFCIILASRGPVYRTKASAGGLNATEYHTNCVVPGTLVSGPPAEVGLRRHYEGEVVTLVTASGNELTITPNHPVLTRRGWVAAGALHKGDDLVSGPRVRRSVVGGPDEDHGPSRIEDVVSALGMVRTAVRRGVPGSAEQFHGDGGDSEVDVVAVNDLLGHEVESAFNEPFPELQFKVAASSGSGEGLSSDRVAALELGRSRLGGPTGSGVGGRGLGLTLCAAHAGSAALAGVGSSAGGDARFGDPSSDSGARDPEILSYRELGLTVAVALDGIGVEGDGAAAGLWDASRRFDPPAPDGLTDLARSEAELGGDLLVRLAGAKQFDRLVDVRISEYHGDVLNLSTLEGWYNANGITVSNCDCEAVPIYDGVEWDGQEQADWLYQNVYLPAIGGKPWIGWESNHWKDNVPVQRLEEWLKEHPLDLPDIRTT